YAIVLFEAFKDKVKYWITMNEQNIFTTLGWMTAQHPQGKFDDEKMYYLVNHHAFLSHAKSVLRFKEIIHYGKIGASFSYIPSYALNAVTIHVMSKLKFDNLKYFW